MRKTLTLSSNDISRSRRIFNKEKDLILGVIGNVSVQIEHIGSTAVPGTIGKGVVDMLAIFSVREEQEVAKNKLFKAGYVQGELDKKPDGRLFFSKHNENNDFHLHLVVKEDKHNLTSLRFRDYLLAHPVEVEKYNREKLKAAKRAKYSRNEYQINKEKFVKDLSNKIDNG